MEECLVGSNILGSYLCSSKAPLRGTGSIFF